MSLIIGTTPFSQWERLQPLFQQLGWSTQLEDVPELPGVIASSSNPCLLLYTCPEIAIIHAMEDGGSPGEALDQWSKDAQVLLDVFRANRDQCVVLEVRSVLKAPAELLEWLKDNQPSWLPLPSDTVAFASASVEPLNEQSLLLATHLVAQTPKVQTLLTSLEASTVPLNGGQSSVPNVDIEGLSQQWQTEKVPKQSLKEVLDQLFKVQEELEKYYLQTKRLKEQLRVANRDLTQTHKKLQAIRRSPFWRITAPARYGLVITFKLLRRIKRFLARR